MGLWDALAKLTGNGAPHLARPDSTATTVQVDRLDIRTAGQLIIVITGQQGARALAELAGSRESATLVSPTTTVHFPAVPKDMVPVKDPKHGWIIPITPALANSLSQAALASAPISDSPAEAATTGEYELSPSLAVVVE
ncbi:hypothetical protein GWO53_02265 [Corynebacterium macginleyi]|uniref:Uncharacterized protein n=1 Tax=Corynebacterium macginleyi TaxID=38290 RepID=A0A3M0G2Q1_9CORY|nr:hypothetical protein [Corynebacterium macginleyi]MBK4139353.1 hypothetical protein [Corynebacterium macginleyi]MBK4166332.1 hypothetical protein [Corynebacterium macginleyi]RMB56472.1 hypothetical protein D9543_11195 [Corynebacterium macginleyi]